MIDLHCHMLPGIDDGARDLATALKMAQIAVDDGIKTTACTPHIFPGLYENDANGIAAAVVAFSRALEEEGIPLGITYGADIQIVPELVSQLRSGAFPTLAKGRYFLFEPPHHIAPPRFGDLIFNTLTAGFVPVITHPERLTWIEDHYAMFVDAVRGGAWIQLTAGSLVGRFGPRARYWSERMVDEGLTHLLATDAHGTRGRPPLLREGVEAAAKWVGVEEAERMVGERAQAVLGNREPGSVEAPLAMVSPRGRGARKGKGLLARLFGSG